MQDKGMNQNAAAETASTTRLTVWTGVILGVALMGAVDEIVFHQLLQWHHFYSDTTSFWRIFSDGLFHAFTTLMWFVGAALLWRQRRRLSEVLNEEWFWGGFLLGMGGFQVFDGIVNHKVLALHQVREGTQHLMPYDVAWNLVGVLLAASGWALLRRARGRSA